MPTKRYIVTVRVTSYETWAIEAENEKDARERYHDGHLKGDAPDDVEVTDVKEVPHA